MDAGELASAGVVLGNPPSLLPQVFSHWVCSGGFNLYPALTGRRAFFHLCRTSTHFTSQQMYIDRTSRQSPDMGLHPERTIIQEFFFLKKRPLGMISATTFGNVRQTIIIVCGQCGARHFPSLCRHSHIASPLATSSPSSRLHVVAGPSRIRLSSLIFSFGDDAFDC